MSIVRRFGLRSAGITLALALGLQFVLFQGAGAQTGNTTGGITVGSGNTITIGFPTGAGTSPLGSGTNVIVGNLTICGPVTAFTAGGTLTQSGVLINLAGATLAGMPIVVGGNFCSQVQLNVANNQVMNVFVTGNPTGAAFMCTTRCFLLSPAGVTTGTLSLVPIAATPTEAATEIHRVGRGYQD
jgi:hypothetical protein